MGTGLSMPPAGQQAKQSAAPALRSHRHSRGTMAAWTVGLQMAEVGGKEAARRKASWRHQQQEQSLAKEGPASCLGSSTSTSDGLSKLMDSREGL